jgi:hypothetical protein
MLLIIHCAMRAAVIFLAHVWAALGTASAFLFVTG